jgi:hypothetical protein
MANTTTTTGSKIAVVADWSGFVIADRIGATALIAGWTVGLLANAKAPAAPTPSCRGGRSTRAVSCGVCRGPSVPASLRTPPRSRYLCVTLTAAGRFKPRGTTVQ